MAKNKESAFDTFLTGVLSNVPVEQRDAMEATLRGSAVADAVTPLIMTRSDYSRSKDAVDQQQAELAREKAEWQRWYQETSVQAAALGSEKAELEAQVRRFEAAYGPLSDGERAVASRMDPKELEQALLQRVQAEITQHDMASFKVMDLLSDLKMDHRDTFKERLDTDALVKFATEQGLPLKAAYDQFVAPRVAERNEKAHEDALAKARADGAADALSKHRLPAAPVSTGPNIFSTSPTDAAPTEFERQLRFRDSFVANTTAAR